ncbi:hypothetical protein BC835DRAFT_1528699 [Cytidiella melzeri]|nr:hypothetical protein BC835DRAFT_1528699 [Cytidiella melzeri]
MYTREPQLNGCHAPGRTSMEVRGCVQIWTAGRTGNREHTGSASHFPTSILSGLNSSARQCHEHERNQGQTLEADKIARQLTPHSLISVYLLKMDQYLLPFGQEVFAVTKSGTVEPRRSDSRKSAYRGVPLLEGATDMFAKSLIVAHLVAHLGGDNPYLVFPGVSWVYTIWNIFSWTSLHAQIVLNAFRVQLERRDREPASHLVNKQNVIAQYLPL